MYNDENDYELLYLISESNEEAKEVFFEKYKPTVAYKIVDGNVGVNENKLTIPHYMVMFL